MAFGGDERNKNITRKDIHQTFAILAATFIVLGKMKRRPINGYPEIAEILSDERGEEFDFCPDEAQSLPLRNNAEAKECKSFNIELYKVWIFKDIG